VISYCIACYRPTYATLLIEELIAKTSVEYEILLWINAADEAFDRFLQEKIASGACLRIVGRSPQNIGMTAYTELFAQSRFDMATQIDDDVVCIGPLIAETARHIFNIFPSVGMITSDVWQDDQTTGARPPIENYRLINADLGLYDGPIDGWFAIYRKSALLACRSVRPTRYYPLGAVIRKTLNARRMQGLLCTRMKVFHVIGPCYANYFGMLDSEIAKYRELGRHDIVKWYEDARPGLPSAEETEARVQNIRHQLARSESAAAQ
jgi:hypothetical protein